MVVTQFGRVIGKPKIEPGLYFKVPAIKRANSFPKNLLEWSSDSEPVPTLDKTFITVGAFARWKIVDPRMFFQTVNTVEVALSRLDDILSSSIRNLITSHPLIETVRMTKRELDTFEAEIDELDGSSEAYKNAAEIKGKPTRNPQRSMLMRYRDPDFYSFYNTLVIYREVMDKNSSLFLSTDSDLLKYFKGLDGKSMDEGR